MMKSNSIVESINDVGLSVKVMEDLMSRNLQHFVVPSESNNNSICIMIYENERWSTMVKQWGSVLGVHLYVNSILRDRRPLTDETGKHILSETLSDLKPINKFKWREDWTVMVDFSTDNLGFHYASDWLSLSDPKKRVSSENKSTGIRRRRWKRFMVFDSDNQLQTLPYVLTIKIKSASFTGKITPAHKIEAYVETFMNDVLLDRTLTGQPKWNRVIVEKLLYLEPSSTLLFQLFRKKRSNIGFMHKGTLRIQMSEIIDLTNRGPYEVEYTLEGDKPRKLQIEWDLKETKLFYLVKMRSRNSPQCTEDAEQERDQLEKKLTDRFMSTFSSFHTMKSSLKEVIIDCLLEEPGVLPQDDMLTVLEDLLETKKYFAMSLEHTESSEIRLQMRRNAARQSEETIIYPYGKFNYLKCLSFRTLFSENNEFTKNTLSRQKEIADINEKLFENQPIRSSLFDVRFENYLLSSHNVNMSMTGYELTIDTISNLSYELHWQTYYDYIMVLKELSKVRFSKYDMEETPEFSSPVKYMTDRRTWKDVTLVISYKTQQIAIKEIHVNVVNGRRASSSFSYNNFMRGSMAEVDDSVVEIFIPFNTIENFETNYSNHMSMMNVLEVKVVSLTSHLFRNAISSHLDIDCPTGTHFRTVIDCETANKTGNYFVAPTVTINETFSFLLNDKYVGGSNIYELGDFLYFTFHSSDAEAMEKHRNNRKSIDATSNQPSRSLFSFGNSSSRKSVSAPPTLEPISHVYSKISFPVKSLVTPASTVVKTSQIHFNTDVSHFLLKFKILKGDNIISVDGNEHVSTYFVLYFADADGNVLPSQSYIDTSSKAIIKGSTVNNLNGIKPGFLYRSKVYPKSHCPLWNDEVEISSELFPELFGSIKYILVEVWDKNSMNSDSCIGEVFISIHAAINSSKDESYQISKYALQFSKSTRSRAFGRHDVDRLKLGNLYAVLTTSDINKPHSDLGDKRVAVDIQCSLRPLQIGDCAWPCRVLSSAKSGLEDFVLNSFVCHNSLVLSSFDSSRPSVIATNSRQSEKFKALQECVENLYIDDGDSKLKLIIPFNQIVEDSIFILSENMIFLTVIAMRRIVDSGAGGDEESVRTKGISIDLVVGPCLASDLYSTLTNRIALQNTKSKLLSFIMQDFNNTSPEVYKTEFQSTTNLMQFEIFSVIENIANTTKKCSIIESKHQVRGNIDPNCVLPLRVLLFQKAWLRVYYWYLMSFEPLKISNGGSTQAFTMQGIEVFTNYAKELLSSTICVDEDDQTGQGVLRMDPTSLLYNIRELMNKVVEDVRELFYDSFIHERPHLLTSALLSKLVFDQYLLIVLYLTKMSFPLENNGNRNIRETSPQDKRDLIVFIISHDDLIESSLNMLLLSYNFSFSVPPLLSLCIDFDKLIGEFSLLLDENLKQWNTRALKHFLSNAERSTGSNLPWDITTIVDETSGREMFISSVPETIQMQLNVQIGLKKIPVPKNATWSSLQRICKINLKISAAVAKSYIGLAAEFDQVLTDVFKSEEFSNSDDDELMVFLLSIVNDCHRIIYKHIKESMDFFKDDSELERLMNSSDAMSERIRSHSSDDRRQEENVQQSTEMAAIQASRDQVFNLFANSSRVIENVSKSALNHLSNQIFFHSKMTTFFLEGLSEYLTSKNDKAWRPYGYRAGSISEPITGNAPIDTICATILDFLAFAKKHLYNEDWEKLVFMCLKKLILRYLVFLRDLLLLSAGSVQTSQFSMLGKLSFRRKKSNISSAGIEGSIQSSSTILLAFNGDSYDDNDGATLEDGSDALSECETNSVCTDRADISSPVARVRSDYRAIFSLYSNTMGENREKRILAEEEDIRTRESDSRFSDDGDVGDREIYPEATYYEHSTTSLLSVLSNTYSQIISGDITDATAVEKIVKNTCYVSVPEYSANKDQYNSRLMEFFMMNSMSTAIATNSNFSNLNSLASSPTYFIQLSEFSCINFDGAKNCFLRISFQENVQETSIQQIVASNVSWRDIIRFNNVQDYQNTVVTVQLVEFRMRPLKALREKILGMVVINLSDTNSPVRSIASHSADVSDSSREPVFDLSGWFEVNTNPQKFFSRMLRRPAGRQGGVSGKGPQLSQKAAATKKAATDLEGGSKNNNSSSSSKSNGKLESSKAVTTSESTKSAVAASTATPREGCSNPQLHVQIIISRSFVH